MNKIYESPKAEIIDLLALEQIALINDAHDNKRDAVRPGSETVDDDMFG